MQARIRALVAEVMAVAARFSEHRGSLAAGGLAFFVSLSIAPAAVVIGWIASLVLDPADVREAINTLLAQSHTASDALSPVVDSLVNLIENPSGISLTTTSIISFGVAIYAASRVVYGTRLALNAAFDVPGRFRGVVERIASAIVTLIGVVAIVAVLVAVVVLPQVMSWLGLKSSFILGSSVLLDSAVGLGVLWFGSWMLMRHTPNTGERLPATSFGPILSAAWIVVVTTGVGLYVQFSRTLNAATAVFGASVVFLMWLYLCFVGVLIGAEYEGLRRQRARADEATAS